MFHNCMFPPDGGSRHIVLYHGLQGAKMVRCRLFVAFRISTIYLSIYLSTYLIYLSIYLSVLDVLAKFHLKLAACALLLRHFQADMETI